MEAGRLDGERRPRFMAMHCMAHYVSIHFSYMRRQDDSCFLVPNGPCTLSNMFDVIAQIDVHGGNIVALRIIEAKPHCLAKPEILGMMQRDDVGIPSGKFVRDQCCIVDFTRPDALALGKVFENAC